MTTPHAPRSPEGHGTTRLVCVSDPLGNNHDRIIDGLGLLGATPVPVVVLDQQLELCAYNERAASLLRLTPEHSGSTIGALDSPLPVHELEDLARAAIDSREALDAELAADSGRWHRACARSVRDETGAVIGIVLAVLDIDAEKRLLFQAEHMQSFDAAVERIAEMVRSAREPEAAAERGAAIVAETLGASAYEVTTSRSGTLTATAHEPLEHATGAGALSQVALPLASLGGASLGEVRLHFDAPRGPLDDAERCFCVRSAETIARGIEQAQQLNALEQAMLPLEAALQARDEFLGRMSHELRTPLNSIIGFSKLLMKDASGNLNEQQHRQLELVHRAGNHLLALVSNLLDLQRIVAGAMPISVAEFEMAEVLDEVTEMLRPLAESKHIELRIASKEDLEIPMRTDLVKVRQILLNLLSNAIKYTDEGSVTVSGSVSGGTCTMTVSDTGRGMTAEQLGQAFREFEQVDLGPERVRDGTGLGLSIATRLARLLGGDLIARSEPGVGSEFTLVIPCEAPRHAVEEG